MRNINIQKHYDQNNLFDKIIDAMTKSGLEMDTLTRENFSEMDEFHIMGNQGTKLLAEAIKFKRGMIVLDLGCGIGGASRFIADTFDCDVTGIDIAESYVETAKLISDKVGTRNVTFEQANATDLPFEDNSFDVVWTQHVQMNIEDKDALLNEIFRVLKPGGKFAYFDVFSLDDKKLLYPLPWAEDQSISFTCSAQHYETLLKSIGYDKIKMVDLSSEATDWMVKFLKTAQTGGIPLVSPQLLMGENSPLKLKNALQNLKEGKIQLGVGVFEKS